MTYVGKLEAIPTTYGGITFRSKLEAKYAAMFDILKVEWQYEADQFTGYVPDFKIFGPKPGQHTYVEIKGTDDRHDLDRALNKARQQAGLQGDSIIVMGSMPYANYYTNEFHKGQRQHQKASGVHWDPNLCTNADEDDEPDGASDLAIVGMCFECRSFGWCSTTISFHMRPCGHHFGSHPDDDSVRYAWRRSQDAIRWIPNDTESSRPSGRP